MVTFMYARSILIQSLKQNLSVLLALGLLGGMAVANLWRPEPEDVEPYHERVRDAVQGISYRIGDWIGVDQPLPQAAVQLLKPNALFCRAYRNVQSGWTSRLLVVHCRDARDLVGHFPPVCYPAHGWTLDFVRPRDWHVRGLFIPGAEYGFSFTGPESVEQIVIANFMVLPKGEILRDMRGVQKAAADYTAHWYGAAQVQLVTSANLTDAQRDLVVQELVGSIDFVIESVRNPQSATACPQSPIRNPKSS
jgi:hypothetical protein